MPFPPSPHSPRYPLALACLALLLKASPDAAAAEASPLTEAAPAATALTIVAPDFPAGASAGASGTRVDVEGTVLADGSFELGAVKTEAGMEPFGQAVREVLRWWRFVPAIDRAACTPRPSPSQFAVWFEGTSAAPQGSVSLPKEAPQAQPPRYDRVSGASPTYPRRLVGVEGQVQVLRLIDPAGKVKAVAVRSSTPYGAFDETVLAAARRTSVTWAEPKPERDHCVEQTYMFCMGWSGDVRVAFRECRHPR